ncbi:arginase family protein [Bacillus alveayuensis]|jgi:arginase family enzyme|uniref:arginase family protein n=1 Tax=Aeribacillus alveayuensis TaxID=279215 RepID=UPI0005D132AD|nr:arginase family protein [Bacillus alveayuensis]
MAFYGEGVTFLNFDGTYFSQKQLFQFPHEWLDLTHISQTNLYCHPESLAQIKRRLNERKYKGITFIGSGNYHYVSYLLLQEINEPFTLVLFDHHTDLGNEKEPLISCGSWVSYALEHIPFLERVVMIGPTSTYNLPSYSTKITIFSNEHSPKLILSNIQTDAVYISIDKDVLCRDDALTNWEQGTMRLETLLRYIKHLLYSKEVIGLDVCGEYPQTSVNWFDPLCREALRKNQYANRCLIETCLQSSKHFVHVKGLTPAALTR